MRQSHKFECAIHVQTMTHFKFVQLVFGGKNKIALLVVISSN